MGYGIMTDEGLQMVDQEHEGAMEIVDERPATAEGEVASLSRYEVEDVKSMLDTPSSNYLRLVNRRWIYSQRRLPRGCWVQMDNSNQDRTCSKVCWELLELTEQQAETIRKLAYKLKELEAIVNAE
jgi:hypothetical protein